MPPKQKQSSSTKAQYLPLVKDLTVKTHISHFKGKAIGIDMSGWIHAAIHTSKHTRAAENEEDLFADSLHTKFDILKLYDIKPVCVFDGKYVDKKNAQNVRRRNLKAGYRAKAIELRTLTHVQQDIYDRFSQQENQNNENTILQQPLPIAVDEIEPALQNEEQEQIMDHQSLVDSMQIESQVDTVQENFIELPVQAVLQEQLQLVNVGQIVSKIVQEVFQKQIQPINVGEIGLQSVQEAREAEFKIYQGLQERKDKSQKLMKRSMSISEEYIFKTMRVLKHRGIPFIVAPYEADPQLVKFFNSKNTDWHIDYILAGDGDFIIYDVPTIYHFNRQKIGDCMLVDLKENIKSKEPKKVRHQLRAFVQMTKIQKVEFAALAGTDYFQSVGKGLLTTVNYYLAKKKNMFNTVKFLRKHGSKCQNIVQDHERHLQQVKLIFLLQIVWNPQTGKEDFLYPEMIEELEIKESEHQLREIVGRQYPYTKEIREGARKLYWPHSERNLTPLAPSENYLFNSQPILQREKEVLEEREVVFILDKFYKQSTEKTKAQKEVATAEEQEQKQKQRNALKMFLTVPSDKKEVKKTEEHIQRAEKKVSQDKNCQDKTSKKK